MKKGILIGVGVAALLGGHGLGGSQISSGQRAGRRHGTGVETDRRSDRRDEGFE